MYKSKRNVNSCSQSSLKSTDPCGCRVHQETVEAKRPKWPFLRQVVHHLAIKTATIRRDKEESRSSSEDKAKKKNKVLTHCHDRFLKN